MTYLHTGEG